MRYRHLSPVDRDAGSARLEWVFDDWSWVLIMNNTKRNIKGLFFAANIGWSPCSCEFDSSTIWWRGSDDSGSWSTAVSSRYVPNNSFPEHMKCHNSQHTQSSGGYCRIPNCILQPLATPHRRPSWSGSEITDNSIQRQHPRKIMSTQYRRWIDTVGVKQQVKLYGNLTNNAIVPPTGLHFSNGNVYPFALWHTLWHRQL